MNINFVRSSEKKEIMLKLKEQFGIEFANYLLIQAGDDKIRAFSGSLAKEEIMKLSELLRIESIGLYLLKKENDAELAYRLSFDATQILSSQIKESIFTANSEQYSKWIRGNDIEASAKKGILAVKYESDFMGCGRSTGEKITNHVPKERRLKSKEKPLKSTFLDG